MDIKLESPAERLSALRALAIDRRWIELRDLLDRPAYRALYDRAASIFEEIGDQRAAANEWGDALRCYHFGLWRALQKPGIRTPADGNPQAALTAIQLHMKFGNALQQIPPDDVAFCESCTEEAIELAGRGQFDSAEEILNWLRILKNTSAAEACAAQLANIRKKKEPAPAAPPVSTPPAAAPGSAVRFEQSTHFADVQRAKLAKRFPEAAAFFDTIQSLPVHHDDRRIATANHFEEIADRLASRHPNVARWLYRHALDEYVSFASSADTAYEGRERWGWVDGVKFKLTQIKK